MSGAATEADKNRKHRRHRQRPSVKDQRFASLCVEVANANRPHDHEAKDDYLRRIRNKAARVQREQRRAKRKRNR